jgi:hypothetical protein
VRLGAPVPGVERTRLAGTIFNLLCFLFRRNSAIRSRFATNLADENRVDF